MQIDEQLIQRIKNYKKAASSYFKYFYGFSGDFNEFIDLSNVSYRDKIYVAKGVLNVNQVVRWTILCAESVLYIFENKYPQDSRVTDCINYLKTINDFSNLTEQQKSKIKTNRDAAYAAANAAYAADATAYAAAYAAANAAANAAHAAYAAANAANAAANAAHAADNAADARIQQQNLNLQFLKIAYKLGNTNE